MAKKNLNPLEDPPTASSSDEDEVNALSGEEAEEEISDDSSSEEDNDDLMIPPATKPKTPGSELSPPKHGPKKPIAVTVANPKESSSSKSGIKRPSGKTSSKRPKKRSKKVAEDSEKKPLLFQRLWSEEDEISLLQGMIDFKSETGKSPYEDLDGFYEFSKKLVRFDASKNQSLDKIRSLKKKYMGKLHKGVESLPKAHDMECLKLSKSIWGSGGVALKSPVKKNDGMVVESGRAVRKKSETKVKPHGSLNKKKSEKKLESLEANGDNVEADREVLADGDEKEEEDREVLVNGKKVEVDKEVLVDGEDSKPDWFEESFLVGYIAGLGVGEGFVKQKWSMVSVETKKKLEDKWKLLQAKEMELVLQKTDFMREVGSVIAEAS